MLVVQAFQKALCISSRSQFSTSDKISLVTGVVLSLLAIGLGGSGLLGIMTLPTAVSLGLIILAVTAIMAIAWIIRIGYEPKEHQVTALGTRPSPYQSLSK